MRSAQGIAALVLAVTAATLATSAPASAAELTVLCEAEEAPCEKTYVEGTKLIGTGSAQFTAIVFEQPLDLTCGKSKFEAKTQETKGNPRLPGGVFDLTFEECETESGKKCTISAKELAWWAQIEHRLNYEGWVTVSELNPGAVPGAEVSCEGSTLFNCSYWAMEGHEETPGLPVANLEVLPGEKPIAAASGVELEPNPKAMPKCMVEELFMSAEWDLTEPGPLWVSYAE